MQRFLLILGFCALLVYASRSARPVDDFRDAAAVDLAVATMTDGFWPTPNPHPPSPYRCPRCQDTGWITHGDGHRTPCPDCQDGSAGAYGGPLDMYRDAQELIRKGNELADRGKAILDRAERDGKITLEIQLPKPSVAAMVMPLCEDCPAGICPPLALPPADTERKVATTSARQTCTSGTCRPGLLWRRRR